MNRISIVLALVVALPGWTADPPTRPGPTATGFLLPNGWHLTPAGRHFVTTDLPLNIVPLKDGRHALVGTSGFNPHRLSLIDLTDGRVLSRETVIQSWFGLAVAPDEKRVWWAGGGAGLVHTFDLIGDKLTRTGPTEPAPARGGRRGGGQPSAGFRSGVCLAADGQALYSLDIEAGKIAIVSLDGAVTRSAPAGQRPYDVILSRNGALLYVSDWVGRQVLSLHPTDLRTIAQIPVGEHPNQMALHPRDHRL